MYLVMGRQTPASELEEVAAYLQFEEAKQHQRWAEDYALKHKLRWVEFFVRTVPIRREAPQGDQRFELPGRSYIVMGSTGEWADTTTWLVASYQNKAEAEKHRELANAEAKRRYEHEDDEYDPETEPNPYDPKFSMWAEGTEYYVTEVEARNTAPSTED